MRAAVATTLAGDGLLTQDGRLVALRALVHRAQEFGHDLDVEAVSALVAWLIGPRRARRVLALSRTFYGADG